MSVSVLVAIEDAVAWEPWLTTELGQQAERLGLGYDGGEEDGPFEVFDFEGDVDQVERAVTEALRSNGVQRRLARRDDTITVTPELGRWLIPLTSKGDAYGRALHKAADALSDDPALKEWWAHTGLYRLKFHEAHEPGRAALFPGPDHQTEGELYLMHFTDLSIVDGKPTKTEADQVAKNHVREVLQATAEHIRQPLPSGYRL